MTKKKAEQKHTRTGWNYSKVNRVIESIHDILIANELTFVEEMVILEWFKCELIYNLGKRASDDYFKTVIDKFEHRTAPSGLYG